MRDALLLLFSIIILVTLFVFLEYAKSSEGFSDLKKKHSNYVTRQLKQYNSLGISLLAAKKEGALGTSADNLLNTFGQQPAISYPLNEGKGGLWAKIDKCELVKKADCSAFDDPEFSKHCGLCLDIGENSEKEKTTGGLLLLGDDKKFAREKTQSNFLPDYKPTIGICPAKKMVSTKSECLKLQRQLLCEKNASYDIPGCSSCYSSTEYSIIDEKTSPGVITGSGQISVVGIGMLKVEEQGFSSKDGIVLDPSKPYVINLRVKEAGRVKFSLSPPRNSDPENPTTPYISGVLSGETSTGTFTHDIRQIVLVDEITGRKPRSSGKDTINDTSVTRMLPSFGKTTAVIVVILPFSFVEQTMEEGSKCKDAPFITKQASAEFLQSDPCYKKGSGPGKYNLECLQGTWTSNGCTESGKGYPKDDAAARKLMTSSSGSFLTINDISDYIYNQALISSTGIDKKGVKRQTKEQSEASVFCTGNEITSPCDTANKGSGPLSPDCIIYLWNNQGSKKLWTGKSDPIGPTYYNSESVSEFSDGSIVRGCQATGTLSPIDEKGNRKKDIIQFWQKQGGVDAVKKKMADLHRAANAQMVADDQLAPYFKQCYGDIPFAARPPTIPTVAVQRVVVKSAPVPLVSKPTILNPPPTCPTKLLPSSYKVTANTVIVPTLAMTQDYKLEFDITPTSMGQAGSWRNIIHFTSDNSDAASFGSRTPGIWFVPGTMDLHVRLGDSKDLNWGFWGVPGCAVGKKSNVVLQCKGTSVTLTIDTKSHSLTQPTFRYNGNVKVYGSDPWYPPADATITNMCLTLSGNSYSPPVDSRQNMIYNNTNINGGGASVNRNLGNFPNMNACIAAGRRAYPDGNYAVTFAPGQCWAIGPTNPYDRHFNPARGWTSAYFRAANEKLPGIEGVVRVQLAGGWGTCLNFSQLVVLNEKGENISRGRRTEGSGQWEPASNSARAVDGEEWPRGHPNEYHSSGAACGANVNHWQVTLDRPSTVSAVIIYNRADCCQDRLSKQNMHMFNSAGDLIYWKPTMGTALINVLPTNGSTNRAKETKGTPNMYCYSNRYPDLYNAFDKPFGPSSNHAGLLSHFNVHGRREGRNPNC